MKLAYAIDVDLEADGRWFAKIEDLPGVMAYGTSRTDAIAATTALALRVLADRVEHGEATPDNLVVAFREAA